MSLTNPMTKGIYQGLIPVLNSDNEQIGLQPNIGGTVTFYAAGTTNAETVYTDPTLTTPYPAPSNVVNLNSQGWAEIYLASKSYKYVEADSNGNPVFVQDNFVGGNGFGSGFAASIADLKNVDTNLNKYTYVAGYYFAGDGGEGMFYNKASNEPDDGGYVIQSTFDPSKDWFRIPDENGNVRAASFGYIPSTAGDQTAKLQAADAYASTLWSTPLVIQAGNSATITAITLNSPVVIFNPGAQLNASSPQTVTFAGIVQAYSAGTNNSVGAGIFSIFGTNITAILNASQIAIPEWFGATLASPDNAAAFTKLWACGAGGFKINPGTWTVSATTPPTNKRILSFGVVTNGTVIIPIGEYYFTARNGTVNGPFAINGATTIIGNTAITGTVNVTGAITTIGVGADITSAEDILATRDSGAGRDVDAVRDINAGRDAIIVGNTTSAKFIESAHPTGLGYWTAYTPTFTLSNGNAPSTVTGLLASYMLVGKTMFIRFIISRFDVNGTNNAALPILTMPGGFTFKTTTNVEGARCAAIYSFNNGALTGPTNCFVNDNTTFFATAYGFGDGSSNYTHNLFSGMLIAEIN